MSTLLLGAVVAVFAMGTVGMNLLAGIFCAAVVFLGYHHVYDMTPITKQVTEMYNSNKLDTKNILHEDTGKTVPAAERVDVKKVAGMKVFSWTEIEQHRSTKSLWMVSNGLVYDITTFYDRHPGGRKVIFTMAGRDCSDVLNEFHPEYVFKMLPKFCIGKLEAQKNEESNAFKTNSAIVRDYQKIRQILLHMNMFETDMTYYYKKFTMQAIMLASSISLVLLSDSFAMHMVAALLLGLFWQQQAFIGHDAGHNAITHKRDVDYWWCATLGDFLGGIGMGWWKLSHNVHHINCNSINDDPDIQHLPVFAVNNVMMKNFISTYHEKIFFFDRASKFLVSYQHFLYYPIMAVARFNLYLQTWLLLIHQTILAHKTGSKKVNYDAEYRKSEIVACTGFATWVIMLTLQLNSVAEMACFLLLSHAFAGILHVQICLSHFTMHTYEGKFDIKDNKNKFNPVLEKAESKSSISVSDEDGNISEEDLAKKEDEALENWVLLQLNTTMNVANDPKLDWFHGGLNFQIEHHLFPRLPRSNLRVASYFVQQMCKKHNIPYRALSFYDANVELVGRLRETAMVARKHDIKGNKTKFDFKDSQLYEGLNCIG